MTKTMMIIIQMTITDVMREMRVIMTTINILLYNINFSDFVVVIILATIMMTVITITAEVMVVVVVVVVVVVMMMMMPRYICC